MSNRFHTVEDANLQEFYPLPKELVRNPFYKDLSDSAKLAYAVLKDRHSVSLKNRWIDEQGRVYFLFSDKELGEVFNKSERQVNRYKKELTQYDLIHMERQGLNRRNRIYLLKPNATLIEKGTYKSFNTKDMTNLSYPDMTDLSNQDMTNLSNQDLTDLSYLSKNNSSKNDFSKNDFKKEEEEAAPNKVIKLFNSNFKNLKDSDSVKRDLIEWITKLPVDVICNEIEFAARNGAKTFTYLEDCLTEDQLLGIGSIEELETKRKDFRLSKKNSSSRNPVNHRNKVVREEKLPGWHEKAQKEREEQERAAEAVKAERMKSPEQMEAEQQDAIRRLQEKYQNQK